MSDQRIVAALDIGTSKIVVLVGESDVHGDIYVIGHGQSTAEGLRRGIVVDMDKAVKSIRKAIDDAQLVSGIDIDRVTVGIAGEHIRSIDSHGVIAVGRSDHEITRADTHRAIEAARAVAIPVDREIIHVIPQEYSVDDQSGIFDPIGMSGVRLEVEAHIVTASVTSARNIYRALERCSLVVDHMVMEQLALGEVLLGEDETESGCLVIDIGGGITTACVFRSESIRQTVVIGLGGRNVTNDIAIGLKTTLEQAEEIKIGYGAALASMVDATEMIDVAGVAGRPLREVSRNVLASIIEPRMEEILALVARDVKPALHNDLLATGIVLTGGGSLLPGTVELAEQLFDMPARIGRIGQIEHTPAELNNSRFATVHGLLRYGFRHEPDESAGSGGVRMFMHKIENWITKRF